MASNAVFIYMVFNRENDASAASVYWLDSPGFRAVTTQTAQGGFFMALSGVVWQGGGRLVKPVRPEPIRRVTVPRDYRVNPDWTCRLHALSRIMSPGYQSGHLKENEYELSG